MRRISQYEYLLATTPAPESEDAEETALALAAPRMPKRAALLVLRRYQDWRRGFDVRTMEDAGLRPSMVTAAIEALLFEFAEVRYPRMMCRKCPIFDHEAEACPRAFCAIAGEAREVEEEGEGNEYVADLERIICEFMTARRVPGMCVSTEALAMAGEVVNRVRQAGKKETGREKDRE